MELLRFLFRSSRHMVLALVAASILSGAASAALIAIIHRALAPDGLEMKLIGAAFLVAVIVKAATQFVAQVTLVKFGQGVVLELCRGLCDRVLAAPLARLEAMGSARLLATLNDDVAVLSGAVQSAPAIATNLAMLAGCSVYLVMLSWQAFLLCIVMVVVGVLGYRLLLLRAQHAIQAARDGRDRLFGTFRTLIEGIKELKLNRDRREAFVHDEIDETTEHLRGQNVAAMRQYLVADVWSQLLFFALIAMLLFGAPALTTMSAATLTGYVFAALYMMTPIWSLVGTVPTFMRGKVSLDKIRELDAALLAPLPETAVPRLPVPATPRIELQAASYAYPAPAGEDHGFVLGPVDLRLGPGEVVFVTGGNGCGKSTLVRLLTGLYVPSAGRIVSQGVAVDDGNREAYLQQFAAVFADFHLFERLFGLDAPGRAETIQRYLEVLGMEHKVKVKADRLSTTALSSGQRRRLALLTAYLEDRPVYVFDEWAADQDPNYKQVFYQRLLPELKARGKCVVVVTHDDRYFHLGDRVIKLEAGRIVEDVRPDAAAPADATRQPHTA
jgi:putative pyoverdin transport system ATP-binding/permease protein